LAPNTSSFHFDRLRQAGLVTVKRNGRSLIYVAMYDTMNALIGFLTENCWRARAELSKPERRSAAKRKKGAISVGKQCDPNVG
jgi:hypothetical protein